MPGCACPSWFGDSVARIPPKGGSSSRPSLMQLLHKLLATAREAGEHYTKLPFITDQERGGMLLNDVDNVEQELAKVAPLVGVDFGVDPPTVVQPEKPKKCYICDALLHENETIICQTQFHRHAINLGNYQERLRKILRDIQKDARDTNMQTIVDLCNETLQAKPKSDSAPPTGGPKWLF